MKGNTIRGLRFAALLLGMVTFITAAGWALSTGDTPRPGESYPALVQNDPKSGGLLLKQGTRPETEATTVASTQTMPGSPAEATAVAGPPAAQPTAVPDAKSIPAPMTAEARSIPSSESATRQLDERMAAIERLLEQGRQQDRSMIMLMITITLIVSGVTGLTGIGAIIAVVVLQARWINRVSDSALAHHPTSLPPALGWGGQGLPEPSRTPASVQASRQQFSEAVRSLRQQIAAMENGGGDTTGSGGKPREVPIEESSGFEADDYEVTKLLEKGTQLLDIGRFDRALVCFDQARVLAPERIEVHLKRARTLEQLQRESEALEAFDQVLKLDSSMVAANLGKANILNRLERYNEALECYEKALGHTSAPRRPVV